MPSSAQCKTKKCLQFRYRSRVSSIIILACLFAISSFYCSPFFPLPKVILTLLITSITQKLHTLKLEGKYVHLLQVKQLLSVLCAAQLPVLNLLFFPFVKLQVPFLFTHAGGSHDGKDSGCFFSCISKNDRLWVLMAP